MLTQQENIINNNIENSRLQSVILDYKKSEKKVKAAKIAIIIILILILILSLFGLNYINTSENLAAVGSFEGIEYPYIGDNGNWFLNGEDSGISAIGVPGQTPHIGENGNWFIGDLDTGITAHGAQGATGEVPYIGANGNWYVNGEDTGISASGTKGPQGLKGDKGDKGQDGVIGVDGDKGDKGDDGKDGLTPYIGENGNWWIGDKDTGVPATGGGGTSSNPGTQPPVQNQDGNFTVSIDPQQGNKGLSISESRGFANPVQKLSTIGLKNAWNICYTDIPDGLDSDVGGAKNGQDYFVYTFFLKNVGTEVLDYNELLTLTGNDLDAIKAARFRLYRDGKETTYASPAKDGTKEPHACDEAFTGDVQLMDKNQTGLQPEQVVRYTVIIWFEGDDPECVNDILGGSVKLSLGFKVI